MALVNVAAELAQRGRRVLAVDFDLEAPGLDTFDLPRPPGVIPGLVDFVGEYLVTGQTPAVDKFVFESPCVGSDGGGLWIMPSGAPQDTYAKTLASIDWGELYERHDGYLLFEDLKEQWRECLRPDYVLIDSRTGHTDVGGICTRQLPHAVAILFFPNSQNLRGLTKVVRDIRSEGRVPGRKAIQLHFIMSNVPDLDDEDRILEESISSFEKGLDFSDPLIIHRYDSLSLLNQVVFTKDRPRSRLAKEYHSVLTEIIRHNPLDRDGVLDFLENTHPRQWFSRSPGAWVWKQREIEKHFEEIEKNYRDDGEVLFRLGYHRDLRGRPKEALELFDLAIEAGFRTPEAYLRRAHARSREFDDVEGARKDARDVLNAPDASADQILEAVNIIGADHLEGLANLTGLASKPPQERVWIAEQLNASKAQAKVAIGMLRPLLEEATLPTDVAQEARRLLVLSSIATGEFSYAKVAIQGETPEVDAMRVDQAFNYGMALWGETNRIEPKPFERALECFGPEEKESPTPNHLQCMAVASWVVGEKRSARELARRAKSEVRSRGRQEFSCWRYLQVSASEFERDVDEILRLISGDKNVKPHFKLLSE